MHEAKAEMRLDPRRIALTLGVVAVMLILANVAVNVAELGFGHDYVFGLRPLFDADAEENIPTYFSTALLLSAALILGATAYVQHSETRYWWPWAFLCAGFVLMGYDEASAVHELLVDVVRPHLGHHRLGVFYFSWVIPAWAMLLVLSLIFFKFLLGLPKLTRTRFVLAAAIYLGGAVGMEMMAARFVEQYGREHWQYVAMFTMEESLEMLGAIVFIWALLRHWLEQQLELTVRCVNTSAPR